MSPALSGSSVLQRVELNDALEIRNGIIFDFYSGLPHIYMWQSRAEIEGYSVAYFDRIAVFEEPYC